MLLDRLRRRRNTAEDRLCCYGKLPFDKEFLRFHLDSAEGRRVLAWVDGAHHLMAAAETANKMQAIELRAILGCGGGAVIAALIRPSTDASGTREYPICLFTVCAAAQLSDHWYVTPMWVTPIWESIHRHALSPSVANRTEFAAVLDEASWTLQDPETLIAQFEAVTTMSITMPWATLTGTGGDRARTLAATLVQLGYAQHAARRDGRGIAVRMRLAAAAPDELTVDGAMEVAAWVRLFSAVSALEGPWPGLIEIWRPGAARPQSVCLFGREPTAQDLAYLLAEVGESSIDDLEEPWEGSAVPGSGDQLLVTLLDEKAHRLADLWRASPG